MIGDGPGDRSTETLLEAATWDTDLLAESIGAQSLCTVGGEVATGLPVRGRAPDTQDVCRFLDGEEVRRARAMAFRLVCQKKSSFIHTCLSKRDFVTTPPRTYGNRDDESGESPRQIQRRFEPKRSTKGLEIGSCARAYTLDMARAAMPAATWLLQDTVGDRVAEMRHSWSAPEAHQLTPTVTNHRRATP